MEESRSVSSPGVKEEKRGEEAEVMLNAADARRYRAAAARFNYLGQDRVDVAYAAKKLARRMASPSETAQALCTGCTSSGPSLQASPAGLNTSTVLVSTNDWLPCRPPNTQTSSPTTTAAAAFLPLTLSGV